MESYLEERFGGVQAKNSSEEALRRWRRLCSVVKNPKRRFRFTANLEKRGEAEAIKHANHEKLRVLRGHGDSTHHWRSPKLITHGGVDGIAEKLATLKTDELSTADDSIKRRQDIYGVNKFTENEERFGGVQAKNSEAGENCRPSFNLRSLPSSRPLIPCSQWEKMGCIGKGSCGLVYLGFNSEHGQFCAIKELVVISNDPRSEEQLKQLIQEIDFLKQWSHPNIVQYYGSIMTDEALSIYMEYVSEGSIHKLLANGPFKESMIHSYTAQILSGLAFLHEKRHIHRDIKGANILVGPNNEVKLADFGLTKHIATLTEVHTSCRGTPCWMAPEVFLSTHSGKGYNLSADIWSLGCTVIEMAKGKPPLHGYEPAAAMFKIAYDSTYTPEIPDNLSDEGKNFLQLCLQRDPRCRPSAAELMDHPFIRNQG